MVHKHFGTKEVDLSWRNALFSQMRQWGLLADEETLIAYIDMKFTIPPPKYKYIIFKIDNRKLVPDIKGERNKTGTEDNCCNQEILKHCKSEPRYILCDYCITTSFGRKDVYLALILW